MNPLQLIYQGDTKVPVEIEGVLPERVSEMSLAEIEAIEIFHGNRKVPLREFFTIEGDPTSETMELKGDLTGVHWIGAKMTRGRIHVAGNAGRHVGSEMAGGEIHVEGDAGDWVGGEMKGGRIQVRGRAGHLIGAAYRGSRWGMTGGTILIGGDVGNEIGHTMRRGLLAVGGNIGDLAGFNMIAGTILVFGDSGIRHGAGMHRGTIGLLGAERPEMLPTFGFACRYFPQIFHLLFAELKRLDFAVPQELIGAQLDLFYGDLIEGGRGEIFTRATS